MKHNTNCCFVMWVLICSCTVTKVSGHTFHVDYIHAGRIYAVSVSDGRGVVRASMPDLAYDLRRLPKTYAQYELLGMNRWSGEIFILCDSDIWGVRNGRRRKLISDADEACLSPSGDSIAVVRYGSSIWLVNTESEGVRCIDLNGFDPSWSSQSGELAFARDSTGTDDDATAVVIDGKTLRVLFTTRSSVNPCQTALSPTGTYLAVNFHLSRPVTGDTIFNTETHQVLANGFPDDDNAYTPSVYLPGLVEDWSPNEKWILWDWRVPDPNNDGTWIDDNVGLTSLHAHIRRRIGPGINAKFSPDGRCILFLRGHRAPHPNYDLVVTGRSSKTIVVLARDTSSYFVG